jgi:hypothetical protein
MEASPVVDTVWLASPLALVPRRSSSLINADPMLFMSIINKVILRNKRDQ